MRNISVIGSTGSIGRTALQVVRWLKDKFKVVALACEKNWHIMAEQVIEFSPEVVAIKNKESADEFSKIITGDFRLLIGDEGVVEASILPEVDLVISAIVGYAGLKSTLEMVKSGKTIALANKETLIMTGDYFMDLAEKMGSKIIPIDSEHSAIFQCLQGRDKNEVAKIILTASGGPFLNRDVETYNDILPEEALNHPQWRMGKKITVDSATLFNKGLEIIEAHHLFEIPYEKIDVVIHPQSIVHSFVQLVDGSFFAQLAPPDMAIPIQYAMTYPERFESRVPLFNIYEFDNLEFRKPDIKKFPCLEIAVNAGKMGGVCPTAVSVADEVAVSAFLSGKIRFLDIPVILEKTVDKFSHQKLNNIDDIFEVIVEVKLFASSLIKGELH
ncbi:MAG: 1-deoxy-D-xylulose-5-phosphate reductoisomerase [bacterium]